MPNLAIIACLAKFEKLYYYPSKDMKFGLNFISKFYKGK
ncbi:hypothetical protein AO364_0007 [Moraxella catarrhalis]|nr:hypothetical protein AO364_0007 [Moraxella catarrhalis]